MALDPPWNPTDPLTHSYAENPVEDELRNLFVEVFDAGVTAAFLDENVLGMAHLGSEALIDRILQVDGLSLPRRSNPLIYQYLYRAWKGRNSGRGTEFLQTVLQLFFPGEWYVTQMMQDKLKTYPTALTPRAAFNEELPAYYLTSRLNVSITAQGENSVTLASIEPIIRAILPARFVPHFQIGTNGITALCAACVGSLTLALSTEGPALPLREGGTAGWGIAAVGAPTDIANTIGTLS